MRSPSPRASFTLIELLIVVGIVAILAVVVVLALNPAELLKQSRDSNRLAELNTLNKALALVQVDAPNASFGVTSTVYVSIPDSSPTCANLGLPALPAGYSYGCAPTSTLRATNGTGWVPVNFTALASGAPLSALPIDPVNSTSTGEYYTYNPGGSWELTALLSSTKYREKGVYDGDAFPGVISIGSTHNITPGIRDNGLIGYWTYDEAAGTSAYDSSGNGNTGTLGSSPTWTTGKLRGALSFNGSNHVTVPYSTKLVSSNAITVSAWVRFTGSVTSKDVLSRYGVFDFTTISNDYFYFYFWNNSTYAVCASAGPVSANNWYHVAGTYDGTNIRAYINGALTGTCALGGSLAANSVDFRVGNSSLPGTVDEVRIYNRALSPAEIGAIYAATD